MLSGEQVREARRLRRWSQETLALESQLRQATIASFEAAARPSDYTASCIKRALENGGVDFMPRSIALRNKKNAAGR
jgi:ribosome-binding protein aMBF1 (putative translation factor)